MGLHTEVFKHNWGGELGCFLCGKEFSQDTDIGELREVVFPRRIGVDDRVLPRGRRDENRLRWDLVQDGA